MLTPLGGGADPAWEEPLAFGQLHVLPYLPFVRVARIGPFDHVSTDLHLEDEVHDILERDVAGMRPRPASPAHVITHAIGRQPLDCMFAHPPLPGHPFALLP